MTQSQKILVEKSGPVTTIILNRPEVKNALDLESSNLLYQAIQTFEKDDEAKVGVLWGAGGSFCSGADLKELGGGTDYEPWAGSKTGPLHKAPSKPLIAAVAGYACAGGLGISLFCDLRVVEEDAIFAVLSRRWGVPMSDGTTVRLPRVVGQGHALDMLMTGRKIGAEEAQRMGLANRVVSVGTSRQAAEELALEISQFPQIAMRSDRQSAINQADFSEAQAIEHELQLAADARRLEAMAGAKRFANGEGRGGA